MSGAAKWVAIALGGALVGGLGVWLFTRGPDSGLSEASGGGISSTPVLAQDETLELDFRPKSTPAFVVDVASPGKLKLALQSNGWVKEALAAPLGRGFADSWLGFLGSRGEELGSGFTGTVLDFMLERVLSAPFQLVWFGGGPQAPDTGVIVIPSAPAAAKAAFELLDRSARRGTVKAAGCLDEAGGAIAGSEALIARWLIGDHAVFAAVSGARISLSREPNGVLQGLCAAPSPAKTDSDLALTLNALGFGREAEQLSLLTGMPAPRFEFRIENNSLLPVGISGEASAARLARSALPEALLGMVPEDVPVVLGLGLKLPKTLSAQTLGAHFKKADGALERHLVLVWVPHGDGRGVETALGWSRPEDREGLDSLFSEYVNEVCGLPVVSSSDELLERMRASCAGRLPSLLQASPKIAEGLRAPSTLTLAVHPGRILSRLTEEAYVAESGNKPRPEIEDARRLLEALPFIGLRGRVDGSSLEPGGFGS